MTRRIFDMAEEAIGKEAENMAVAEVESMLTLLPRLLEIPHRRIWMAYDEETDVFT